MRAHDDDISTSSGGLGSPGPAYPGEDLPGESACHAVRMDLCGWLDGELDGAAAASVTQHLEVCPECRALEWELRDSWSLLGALPPRVDADADRFVASVRDRIAVSHHRRVVLLRWAGALATAAALTFAVLFGLSRTAGGPEGEMLRDLPILVDLQQEAGDLSSELLGRLFDQLDDGPAEAESADQEAELVEFFLEEELEGLRS